MTGLETLRLALFLAGPTCIIVGLRLWHSGRVRAEDRARRERQAQQDAAEWRAQYDKARTAYWLARLDGQEV